MSHFVHNKDYNTSSDYSSNNDYNTVIIMLVMVQMKYTGVLGVVGAKAFLIV